VERVFEVEDVKEDKVSEAPNYPFWVIERLKTEKKSCTRACVRVAKAAQRSSFPRFGVNLQNVTVVPS